MVLIYVHLFFPIIEVIFNSFNTSTLKSLLHFKIYTTYNREAASFAVFKNRQARKVFNLSKNMPDF